QEAMAAGEIAHQAARFLDQQCACGHVPLGKSELPEGVEATGSDIGQIQARSASAAHAGSLAYQAAEHIEVGVQVVHLPVTEREASAQQGAFEALARADTQAATIQGSAATAAGGELFLADRINDHGVLQSAAVFAGNADCIVRNAAQEVGGAIQRIDDPQVVGAILGALRQPAFFSKNAVVWIGLAQCGDAELFRVAVDFGNVVAGVFFADRDHVQALGGTNNHFAGAAGGAQRDIQHGLHRSNTWSFKESREFYQKPFETCCICRPSMAKRWLLP